MTTLRSLAWMGVLAALVTLGSTLARAQQDGFIRIAPDEVQFKGDSKGIQQAVLYGDPAKPGLYVIRVKFPPGVMSRPHTHNTDRMVIVVKGPWFTGTSKVFDPATTVPVPTAGFMIHPAGAVHYDGAKGEEVIVQITGMGPVVTTPVQP